MSLLISYGSGLVALILSWSLLRFHLRKYCRISLLVNSAVSLWS